jgi:hypothetical protein
MELPTPLKTRLLVVRRLKVAVWAVERVGLTREKPVPRFARGLSLFPK